MEANHTKLLNNMIELFERYNVPKEEAKKFIIQQAGLDLILGNNDRKENPGNFVFLVHSGKNENTPLNMDYGRCLQVIWTETSEKKIGEFTDREEIIKEMAKEEANLFKGGGLFGGSNLKKSVDFLLDNGFEPLNLNKNEFLKSFEDLEEKINKNNLELKYYLKLKKEFIINILENKEINRLLKEGA